MTNVWPPPSAQAPPRTRGQRGTSSPLLGRSAADGSHRSLPDPDRGSGPVRGKDWIALTGSPASDEWSISPELLAAVVLIHRQPR